MCGESRKHGAKWGKKTLTALTSKTERRLTYKTFFTYHYTEFDTLYADPEISFKLKMADIPLIIQEKIFANAIDDNGVLIRTAQDKPPYFAIGFKSEKSDGKFRYVWLYKVRAKPVTENFATKEGKTINRQTPEVEFTAIKRTHDGRYQAVADEGEGGFTTEKAAAFLTSVYEPSFTP